MADQRCIFRPPNRPPQQPPQQPPQEPPSQETDLIRTLTRLPETLVPGRSIRVRGFILSTCNRFTINLQNGERPYSDDVILHFDVRFQQNVVVRNNFVRGTGWVGPEELDGNFPFRRDSRFEVIFTVEQNFIRMTVNGTHFANFNHRMPFTSVTHLYIHNEVDVRFISFEEAF